MKTIQLEVSLTEANLIMEGLGQMPYVRVFELIQKLQGQAQAQMQPTTPPTPEAANAPVVLNGPTSGGRA